MIGTALNSRQHERGIEMEILNMNNEHERKKMLELCKNLWEKRSLIPVIGAGFSCGTPTDNSGNIQSVTELREVLLQYITQYSKYDTEEIADISKQHLSELASSFWDIFDRIPGEKVEAFYQYISTNFQDVSFFKEYQKAFLSIQWPYVFTLNYDTLIEDYSKNYYPVIPFDKINKYHAKDKVKLYKIHGDVKRYLSTGDSKYFILSRDQYIQSMMSDQNKDMLDELLTAFSSKSILFFGCGLSEELDLLYSAQLSLSEKTKNIDSNYQSIIYINFESEESITQPLSQRKIDRLSRYGVTVIFRIPSEEGSAFFFNQLLESTSQNPENEIEQFLEKFSSVEFCTLAPNDKDSRYFLFQENMVWKNFKNHVVTIPAFNIKRDVHSVMTTYFSTNEPLSFISGNFYSGKTFSLLEAAKLHADKKVYIFPSGTQISDAQLDALLEKENALSCFDTKSLTTAQIKVIAKDTTLQKMKSKKSRAIVAIDKSDAPMYKYIFESRNVDKEFRQFSVSGVFSIDECNSFNDAIGGISLPPMERKQTILDYIVQNESKLLGSSPNIEHFLEPHTDLLAKNTLRRIQALIMLATEVRITAKRAIQFKIDGAINEIIKLCGTEANTAVIERDYSSYNGDSSGFEYVCNSKYWVIRALSGYAREQKDSINTIAKAYLAIIEIYRSLYCDDDVLFYQSCEPYYFFDHIQLLFNRRWFPNSTTLMNAIYDKLLLKLSNSYQFLHQKAKGKLVIAQTQLKSKKYRDTKDSLQDAVFNITRAQALARQYPDAKHIDETLLHMAYTAGRIYIQYSCVALSYVPQAVDACYELYQMQKESTHDIYDYSTSAGNDKWAFDKFKNTLMFDKKIRTMQDLDEEKTRYLLQRWTGMRMKFVKGKVLVKQ